MTCRECESEWERLAAGATDIANVRAALSEAARRHYVECPQCQTGVEQAVWFTRTWGSKPAPMPNPDFTERVLSASRAAGPVVAARISWRALQIGLAVAASIALIVVVGNPTPPVADPAPLASVATPAPSTKEREADAPEANESGWFARVAIARPELARVRLPSLPPTDAVTDLELGAKLERSTKRLVSVGRSTGAEFRQIPLAAVDAFKFLYPSRAAGDQEKRSL